MIKRLQQASPTVRALATIVSFGVSLLAFGFLTGNIIFPAIVMASAALHELCHLIAFRRLGIKSGIIFLTFFALTYQIDPEEISHQKKLKSSGGIWVSSAGVIGNCILGLISLALSGKGNILALIIASINFNLALLNLAPGGNFDGRRIADSITYLRAPGESGRSARRLLFLTEAIAVVGIGMLLTTGRVLYFVGMIAIYFFGLDFFFRIRKKAPPQGVEGSLTKKEATKHALVYLGLVVIALVGLQLLPPMFT